MSFFFCNFVVMFLARPGHEKYILQDQETATIWNNLGCLLLSHSYRSNYDTYLREEGLYT